MSETLNVVTLLGSLRKGSFNGMVARTLPKIAPAGMEVNALPSIGDIPLYDADLQQEEGFPASVEALAEQIRKADGVVIVTPEYNYSVPGGLKNAIDWLSRLPDQPLSGKPVLIADDQGNASAQARAQQAPVPLLDFVSTDGTVGDIYGKPTSVAGHYLPDQQERVLGADGVVRVLSALQLADGRVVGGLFFRIVEGIFKHCDLGRARIDEGQAAEKQRHVDLGAMQQVGELAFYLSALAFF